MSILHAIVLGVLQGLSEFFPISSSGHLIGVPWLLGWDDFDGDESLKRAFDVALHLGTLIALIFHLWPELWNLFKKRDLYFPALIVGTSIPAALVGVAFFNEETTERIWLLAMLLIIFGVFLGVADLSGSSEKEQKNFNLKEAAILGLSQVAALWPGVSRSGVIITVGRSRGFSRQAIIKLSFWMAIPVIAGAALYKFIDIGGVSGIPSNMRPGFLVGMLVSAVVGYLSLKLLLKLVERMSLMPMVVERVLFGGTMLIILATSFR